MTADRNRSWQMFYKIGVLKNSWNPQENAYVGVSLSLTPPATLLKKRLQHRCLSVDFATFLKTPFIEHLQRLLFSWTIFSVPLLNTRTSPTNDWSWQSSSHWHDRSTVVPVQSFNSECSTVISTIFIQYNYVFILVRLFNGQFPWKPFKNDEKCFYFILKALFVLKIFKS